MGSRAADLLRIELDSGEAAVVARLNRYDEPDLRFISFHESPNNVFCLYECGVVCLDLDGKLAWHVTNDDLSAEYVGVKDGAVWFRSQWPPDQDGRRYAFRLSDGFRTFG